MRGATGDDFDRPVFLEASEARDQVGPARAHEILEAGAVEALPARGECRERGFAGAREVRAVVHGGADLLIEVSGELGVKVGMCELFAQHRREAERNPERSAASGALVQNAPQRQVGFGRRLVEPVDAVRPAAVVEHPRQVGVEHERERARPRAGHDLKPSSLPRAISPGSLMTPNWPS